MMKLRYIWRNLFGTDPVARQLRQERRHRRPLDALGRAVNLKVPNCR